MRGKSFRALPSVNLVRMLINSLIRSRPSSHTVNHSGLVSDEFSLNLLRHELRTPLVGILGMSELLRKSRLNGEQRQFLLALEESGRQMQRLVESMAVDRTKASAVTTRQRRFNGLHFMEQIVLSHWPSAKGKGIDLHLSFDQHLPVHWVSDPCFLRQMLDNLLANAVKFTHRGYVLVEARRWAGEVGGPCGLELRVSDTGIGVAPVDSRRIYSVHEQGSDEVSRLYGGSGLGLAVCQDRAKRLGGLLQHEPNGGGGVCFKLSIPDVAESVPAQAERVRPRLLTELRCQLALGEPLNGLVRNQLGRIGVTVECMPERQQHTVPGQLDALFCNSALIDETTRKTPGFNVKNHPVMLWREPSSGVSDGGREGEFRAVALPRPLLQSNLEALLLQLVLQRKLSNLA